MICRWKEKEKIEGLGCHQRRMMEGEMKMERNDVRAPSIVRVFGAKSQIQSMRGIPQTWGAI